MFFRFRYFLEGAMPDELKQLNAQQLQNTKLLRTKLSRLQVKGIVITPKSDLWINFETTSVTRLTVECHLVTPWTQLLEKKFPYKPDSSKLNMMIPVVLSRVQSLSGWTQWFLWSNHVFSHFLVEYNYSNSLFHMSAMSWFPFWWSFVFLKCLYLLAVIWKWKSWDAKSGQWIGVNGRFINFCKITYLLLQSINVKLQIYWLPIQT